MKYREVLYYEIRVLFLRAPARYRPLHTPGTFLYLSLVVDIAWHHATPGAPKFSLYIRQAFEGNVVSVIYRQTGASYCLWIVKVSDASSAISHKIIKVVSNRP